MGRTKGHSKGVARRPLGMPAGQPPGRASDTAAHAGSAHPTPVAQALGAGAATGFEGRQVSGHTCPLQSSAAGQGQRGGALPPPEPRRRRSRASRDQHPGVHGGVGGPHNHRPPPCPHTWGEGAGTGRPVWHLSPAHRPRRGNPPFTASHGPSAQDSGFSTRSLQKSADDGRKRNRPSARRESRWCGGRQGPASQPRPSMPSLTSGVASTGPPSSSPLVSSSS